MIILTWSKLKRERAFIDAGVLKKENAFFEILVLLSCKISMEFFDPEEKEDIENGKKDIWE